MLNYNPRIDAYIENAADFAKPILEHLRELIHQACPFVEEHVKWSMPSFEYKGPFCGFAAYKHYCRFGFWKASLMDDPYGILHVSGSFMGEFGKIHSLQALPPDEAILFYLHEAIRLNDEGIQLPPKPKKAKKALIIPDVLLAALGKSPAAQMVFDRFSDSNKKEYAAWIAEAKTEATRNKRIAQAIEWIAEGKTRDWRYRSKNAL